MRWQLLMEIAFPCTNFAPPLLGNSDEQAPPADQELTEFTRSRGLGGEEL